MKRETMTTKSATKSTSIKFVAAALAFAITATTAFSAFPLTAKAADHAGVTAFVTRMYEVCLDREPDEAGLENWTSQLENGQAKGSDIAHGFIFSEEFQNLNLCNDHYVDSMYESFFGREGDEAGKTDWVGQLNSGATKGHVMGGFVNSEEFANLCASYGIDPGTGNWDNDNFTANGECAKDKTPVSTEKIRAFVNRLYENCLGRTADEAGLEDWTNKLANGMEGSEVAAGFVFSDEYKLKDASDTQFVLMLYDTMLGREADTPGVTNWVLKVRETGSREQAFNGFLGSTEFNALCEDAGITVGNPIEDKHTTGRESTGEQVWSIEYTYINGNYDCIMRSRETEGTLVEPSKRPTVNVGFPYHWEGDAYIAYEGAVSTVNRVDE